MSVRELFEIAGLFSLDEIRQMSREDLLELAKLPENFCLRDLPEFPSPQEIRDLIGDPVFRYEGERTSHWPTLHSQVAHLPKLVQQTILRAFGQMVARQANNIEGATVQYFGYGWSSEIYAAEVQKIQTLHGLVADVLQQN